MSVIWINSTETKGGISIGFFAIKGRVTNAINITDKALKEVGRYSLTNEEKKILIDAGFDYIDIENINLEIKSINFNQ